MLPHLSMRRPRPRGYGLACNAVWRAGPTAEATELRSPRNSCRWYERKASRSSASLIYRPAPPSKTRYLVKRLHAALPEVRILVGRWGPLALADDSTQLLRDAGATLVASTVAETRAYLGGLVEIPRVRFRGQAASRPPNDRTVSSERRSFGTSCRLAEAVTTGQPTMASPRVWISASTRKSPPPRRHVTDWKSPRPFLRLCCSGATLLSTGWRGRLEVCSSTTTEEPHTAIVHPLLVRLPDG